MKKSQKPDARHKKPPPNTSVTEVYELSLKLLDRQRDVINTVHARTATYIGFFGVAVVILVSFGGLLIEKIVDLPGPLILRHATWIFSFLYALAIVFLGIALYFALRAYHFGGVPPPKDEDPWDRKITIRLLRRLIGNRLRIVEIDYKPLPTWVDQKPEDFKRGWGQHFLEVYGINEQILLRRGDFLNTSFLYTFFAILTLGVLVVLIVVYIWLRANC